MSEPLEYIGELLWPGIAGRLSIILCFVSALAGVFIFLKAGKTNDAGWKKLSRIYFGIHAFSVLAIIGLLLFVMISHRYEYQYAWSHVSNSLPMRYIFSAFWEGQEGSFLLWMFWHMVLGVVLLWRNDPWVYHVVGILLAIQCVIASMLLGLYIGETSKVGSNPFLLLRDTMDAPLFSNPNYLSMIEGNGLNPLLQNYWMTIHPPTLFLGFASVAIPFCYAIAGLLKKDHSGWLKPVMPWALFSGAILGTGILMGGAWAYEALSFGGYWAWDPVENMSLVPWIVLVAAIHGNLVARKTGYSIRMTYGFYLLAFLLVLYSTFLTRSGILGDSSAHAFTEMGLEWQLTGFILLFSGLALWLFIRNYKQIPSPEKEEKLSSREFWMFIGSLVLFFGAVLITFTTSIPVYNKLFTLTGNLFNTDFSYLHRTAPIDPIAHYNKYQLWIAVFIALLSGAAQFLRYREPNWTSARKSFASQTGISAIVAAGVTYLLTLWIDAKAWQYVILLFSGTFAVTTNLLYIVRFLRFNLKEGASAIAHLGFGLMLIGIMASGLNKHIISSNVFAQAGLMDEVDPRSHIYLIKDRPMFMNGYWVEYEKDTIEGNTREFTVTYKKINDAQDTVERFTLKPNVIFNRQSTKLEATNPSTKRYLEKDIFTYIAALPLEQMDIEAARAQNDTMQYDTVVISAVNPLEDPKYSIEVLSISLEPRHAEYFSEPGDIAVQVQLRVTDKETMQAHLASPILYLRENLVYGIPAQINDLNLRIRLSQDVLFAMYPSESTLSYQFYRLKMKDTIPVGEWKVQLVDIDREASHPQYIAQDGDIAVNAVLKVWNQDMSFTARPLFYIRGSAPGYLETFLPDARLHIRFLNILPQTEEFDFSVAYHQEPLQIPLELAHDVARNDIIVMQAIVFPGINFFWIGSCMMMIGLFVAMWKKKRDQIVAAP